jgi:hypothetical protein
LTALIALVPNTCLADVKQAAGACDGATSDQASASDKHAQEMAVLEETVRVLGAQWQGAVVKVLLARGDADGLALALMIDTTTNGWDLSHIEGEVPQQTIDAVVAREAELVQRAVDRAGEMSTPLLRALTARLWAQIEPAQFAALASNLRERDPGDADVWLLSLQQLKDDAEGADDVTRQLREAASSVVGSRPWIYETARRIEAAFALVTAPAGFNEAAHTLIMDDKTYQEPRNAEQRSRFLQAMGYALALPIPGYGQFVDVCEADADQAALRKPACLSLARTMATRGGSLIDRAIGLNVWHRLAEGGPEAAQVVDLKRTHYWQREHVELLMADDASTSEAIDRIAERVLRPGSSEYGALLDAMREAGIPTEPPPQWLPQNPDVLRARR